jgi:tRNA (cmo5U34)-methyltransferase
LKTIDHETTSWQRPEVAIDFVDRRRASVPYASDQLATMQQVLWAFVRDAEAIVDLGCGDGTVGRAALALYPNARLICVDNSAPMLDRAKTHADSRSEFVFADLRDPIAQMNSWAPDVVVSGYAIHHLSHERKRKLYAEIFAALRPGGVFINVEHVASADETIERIWDDMFVGTIARAQNKPFDEASREYHARPDKADNILAPLETQTEWLREIGYVHVDCYFKYFELAVFGGQKLSGTSRLD